MAKRNLSKKQQKRAYDNYKKRYRAKKRSLNKRGYDMASEMLNKKDYLRVRALQVSEGREININQTIVSEQAYEYSHEVAKRFKKVAEEHGLVWQEKTYTQIRKGAVDVSALNEELKLIHPDWTGYDRANYISNEVFGSP